MPNFVDVRRCAPWGAAVVVVLLHGCGGGGGNEDAAPAASVVQAAVPSAPGACRKSAAPARRTVPALGQGEPEADAHQLGMWSPVLQWTLIPLHAALTPDGRLLSYGSDERGRGTGKFMYDVWSPADGTGLDSHLVLPNTTPTDLFCSAQMLLPQSGQLFLSGGDVYENGAALNVGSSDTNLFDPRTNLLIRAQSMHRPRWYGTPTMLVSGEILLKGGLGGTDRAEVRQVDGSFRLLDAIDTSQFNYYYPRNFLAPDGRVFGIDTTGSMYFVDAAASGHLSAVGQFDRTLSTVGNTSSAVLYAPGKLLIAGGWTTGAATVDFNGPRPLVEATAPLSAVRQYMNLSVLPDGRVVGTGGSAEANQLTGVVNHAEIWSPATGTWSMGASGSVPRLYHSINLLMPDGSVLVGGGGAPGPVANLNAELYFPPYLFTTDGRWAPRPEIVSGPTVAEVGDEIAFDVRSTGPVVRITLVKMGSVTHSLNFDQRFVELPFVASGTSVRASLPSNAATLPPGFWMLFALDASGVPSRAAILRVNVPAEPVLERGWTSTVGGAIRVSQVRGTPYRLECAAGEVMVGMTGGHGLWGSERVVGRLGALCARPVAGVRWADVAQARGVAASSNNDPFTVLCPDGQAVVGFRSRAQETLRGLELACRPLSGDGGVTGATTLLAAVGGTTGLAQPDMSCGDARPAKGIYGRADALPNTFGLMCDAKPIVQKAPSLPATPAPAVTPAPPAVTPAPPATAAPPASVPTATPVPRSGTDC
jgi:hypothetical protein